MQSLRSYFFSDEPKSRIQKCEPAKKFLTDFAALEAKAKALEAEAQGEGQAGIAWRKATILNKIASEVQGHIDKFNDQLEPYNCPDKPALIELMQSCAKTVISLRDTYSNTLMLSRSNMKETASKYVDRSLVGLGVASLFFVPVLPALVGMVIGHGPASASIKDVTGLNNRMPESFKLLRNFCLTIERTGLNLGLEEAWVRDVEVPDMDDKLPRVLLCPITYTLMKEPVICTLDDTTYEREAIVRVLKESGVSPMNREPLPHNSTIDSVLQPNKAIKELIEDLISKDPDLAEQKFQ